LCYEIDDSQARMVDAQLHVADIYVEQEEYQKAIDMYEKIVSRSTNSSTSLSQSNIPNYLFKSTQCELGLLVLAPPFERKSVIQNLKDKLDKYNDLYPRWTSSREAKLSLELLQSIEQNDLEKFSKAIQQFDRISPLKESAIALLLKIKNNLLTAPETDTEAILEALL
jgi:tetratricopeptide (TPR) repeat protein